MLALFVKFRIKPGQKEAFLEASLANSRGSINGQGCFATSVLMDPEDENLAYVFEVFADEEALNDHHEQAYYKTWEAAVSETLAEPFEYVKNSAFPSRDGLTFLKRAVGA